MWFLDFRIHEGNLQEGLYLEIDDESLCVWHDHEIVFGLGLSFNPDNFLLIIVHWLLYLLFVVNQ